MPPPPLLPFWVLSWCLWLFGAARGSGRQGLWRRGQVVVMGHATPCSSHTCSESYASFSARGWHGTHMLSNACGRCRPCSTPCPAVAYRGWHARHDTWHHRRRPKVVLLHSWIFPTGCAGMHKHACMHLSKNILRTCYRPCRMPPHLEQGMYRIGPTREKKENKACPKGELQVWGCSPTAVACATAAVPVSLSLPRSLLLRPLSNNVQRLPPTLAQHATIEHETVQSSA